MRRIFFGKETYTVRDTPKKQGPGPNYFSSSPENVWLDSEGQLYLKLTYHQGRWLCAEVILEQPLGYGVYDFFIKGRFDLFDPHVVVGLFLYKDDTHEIDIELARWGNALGDNLQYVIQPSILHRNMQRYHVKLHGNCTAHRIVWLPDELSFYSFAGFEMSNAHLMTQWTFEKQYPPATTERVHMNLWLAGGHAPLQNERAEIVIAGFSFLQP